MAGEGEQARDRVADHGAAPMADMHRPRRIGRDIFDIDLGAGADRRGAEAVALREARPQHLVEDVGLERKIDEARSRDLDLGDTLRMEARSDLLRERARRHPRFLGEHHRGVGGDVAMAAVARRLADDAREIEPLRQFARRPPSPPGRR